MFYQNRDELDRISKAGAYWYENEDGNPVVRMNASFWLICEKDDLSFTQNAKDTGNWEAWVATAIAREYSVSPATFLDVGANVGYYTNMAAKAGVETFSFEPNPDVWKMLKDSVKLNNSFAYIRNIAIGDKLGVAELKKYPNQSGSNVIIDSEQGDETITCMISTLDQELTKSHYQVRNPRVVLKVDVEGLEPKVWSGSKEFRERYETIWFIEWVPERASARENADFLEDVLKTHDLQLVQHDGTLTGVSKEDALKMEFETLVLRQRG